ncbi:PrgI family protein [Actinacidiphila yeochonensis]|uniref:PrgI family protein n=1 Tax=Actinacidiphila yeochonensis TaxID=89050 RepID=UPI000566364C|nr:PrgI family protein [Actinacidiphila yeochonensis]
MTDTDTPEVAPLTARIPSDISRPDRVLGPFTARQAGVLAATALALYGGYWATRSLMPPIAYVVAVLPVAGAVAAVLLSSRDGIGLDRFLLAALSHARHPKRRVHAPAGVPPLPAAVPRRWARAAGRAPAAMRMPYQGLTPAGVVDLGRDGEAAVAACSTVNFDLRSAAEQQAATASFARWLNSLTGPAQVVVRCHRIDLAPLAEALQLGAPALPHPALEQAARAHGDFLAELASSETLLGREVLLVAREPDTGRPVSRAAAGGRVVQRLEEAARALGPAEITVTPLDAPHTAEVLRTACNPDTTAPTTGWEGDPA